jgi:hypothetical protein
MHTACLGYPGLLLMPVHTLRLVMAPGWGVGCPRVRLASNCMARGPLQGLRMSRLASAPGHLGASSLWLASAASGGLTAEQAELQATLASLWQLQAVELAHAELANAQLAASLADLQRAASLTSKPPTVPRPRRASIAMPVSARFALALVVAWQLTAM